MAYYQKLNRVLQKIFALNSNPKEVVQFGTPTNGRAIYADKSDPASIQTSFYEQGWFPESLSGNIRPYAEDMNGLHFVHSYQLAYLLQAGIPEYQKDTPYFKDCIVRVGRRLYVANADNFDNVEPTTDATGEYWEPFTLGETTIPVGASLEWNGMNLPAGNKWLFEDGSEVDDYEYPELYDVIGMTFGGHQGPKTITVNGVQQTITVNYFNLPKSTGRVTLGYESGVQGKQLGFKGGQFNHQHYIPAHNHGKGSLEIIQSGTHNHNLTDGGHFHTISNHQHKFRFGDNSGALGSGGNSINCATLGSKGHNGTDNNPTEIGWNNGTGARKQGHFFKMSSAALANDGTGNNAMNLNTSNSTSNITIESSQHSHNNGTFRGVVGNVNGKDGDTQLLTVSTAEDTSSNMPYIVKRRIIRVLP